MYLKRIYLLFFAVLFCSTALARENIGTPPAGDQGKVSGKTTANCERSTAQVDLNINNVRARLLTGG